MTPSRLVILFSCLVPSTACGLLPEDNDLETTTASTVSAGTDGPSDASSSSAESSGSPETESSQEDDTAGSDGSSDESDTGSDTEDAPSSGLAIAIAVGRLHACAVVEDGSVRCWGYSDYGQLGNGAALDDVAFRVPVDVQGIADAYAITSFGDHTCALDTSGAAWCWGANDYGQLGDGSGTTSAVPVGVAGTFASIDAGYAHTCAVTNVGGVQCWGHNDYGQLGDGTIENRLTPVAVVGLDAGVIAVTAGRDHTCALSDDGTLRCWGGDTYGELGNDEPLAASQTPVTIALGFEAAAITAGDNDTCAIDDAGGAWCWGKNGDGQLGNGESGTGVESHVPTAVMDASSGATAIAPGFGYTCGVMSGATRCWGSNFDLVLGNGEDAGFTSAVPVDVVGLGTGSVAVATCSGHACALDDSGAVRCWGTNDGGGLGDGSEMSSNVPVAVVSLP
jgi:alpha-tubulin suppressor-like RCC1 family protein